MRRKLTELSQNTISTYRSKVRTLYLKVGAGEATEAEQMELAELEGLLGVSGSKILGPGRPRKWVDQ